MKHYTNKMFLFFSVIAALSSSFMMTYVGLAQEEIVPQTDSEVMDEILIEQDDEASPSEELPIIPMITEPTEPISEFIDEPTSEPTIDPATQKQLDIQNGVILPILAPAILNDSELSTAVLFESSEDLSLICSAHPYLPNTNEITILKIANAEKLTIRFESDFNLETGYDILGIYAYDANINSYVLVNSKTYSGTDLAGSTIEVPGDTAVFRFTSDGSVEANGWQLAEISPELSIPSPTNSAPSEVFAEDIPDSEVKPTQNPTIPPSESEVNSIVAISITPTPETSLSEEAPDSAEDYTDLNKSLTDSDGINLSKELAAPKLTKIWVDQYPGIEPFIRLEWTPVLGATGYRVWRARDLSVGFTTYWDWPRTDIFFPNCPRDITYFYKVSALRDGIEGPASNILGGRAHIEKPIIDTPVLYGSSHVRLSWNEVPGATGYRIWRSETSPTAGYSWAVSLENNTSVITSIPHPSKKYYYKVAAIVEDITGPLSDPTSFQLITLGRPEMNPIVRISSNHLKVSWSAVPGATGYRVWRSLSPTSGYTTVWNLGNTTQMITKVPDSRRYYYKVAALNGSTIGPLGGPASGSTELSSPVLKPIIKGSNGAFGIYWTPVPGAISYRLYRSETSPNIGFNWMINVGNRTSVATKAPDWNKLYYYKVIAILSDGSFSGFSNTQTKMYNGN